MRSFQELSSRFFEVVQGTNTEHLLWLMRRRIEWMTGGMHSIKYFGLPTDGKAKNWFYTVRLSDGPQGRNVEPMWMEFFFIGSTLQHEATLLCTDEMLLDHLGVGRVESSLQEEVNSQLVRRST